MFNIIRYTMIQYESNVPDRALHPGLRRLPRAGDRRPPGVYICSR